MARVIHLGLAVDVETTGLSHADEIIEFAAVRFAYNPSNGHIISIGERYVGNREPRVSITWGAQKTHGIEEAELVGRSLDESKIRNLIATSDCILAHNAAFDRRFVVKLFPDAGRKPWYCSMSGVAWRQMGYKSAGLQTLVQDLGVSVSRAHRGLDDTLAMLELLQRPSPRSGLPFSVDLFRSSPMYR